MVSAVLQRSSFTVDICQDGEEALERIASETYGVLVLSLVRQDPDGDADLLRRLEAAGRPPCVIVISAGSQNAMDVMTSDLIAARIRKPFQIEELVCAVAKCFSH